MLKLASPPVQTQNDVSTYRLQVLNLVKSTGIYALAPLLISLVTLVLAPFLTHTLTRTDYGVLAVLTTAIALMVGITQFGLNNAFFRAYNYDYETQKDRMGVLSTIVILLSLSSIPVTIAVMMLAPQLAAFLFYSSSYGDAVRLAALVVLLQNLTVPGFSWLRAENHAGYYVTLSVANLLVNLGATIVLVGRLHMGISGALLAVAAGYALVAAATLPFILLRAGMRLRFDIAWNLLSFGLPLVSNVVSIWILQLSDRYLLSRLGSLAQTASYTVAYTLGGIVGVIVLSPFSLAWPTAMFAIAKRDDARSVFRLVFRWYSLFLLFATFGLMLVSMGVLTIFFPPSYYAAVAVIPIVAVSMLFFGIYSYFTVGISIQRKTWYAVLLTTISALINVALNIVLIPLYGSIGAALSTLIAYTLLAVIAYIVNQRLYPIAFEIGLFSIALLAGVVLYLGSSLLLRDQKIIDMSSIALYICVLALYGGFLFFLGSRRDRSGAEKERRSVGAGVGLRVEGTLASPSSWSPAFPPSTLGDASVPSTLNPTPAPTDTTHQPINVCMHVLREARHDVRAMRAATALVEAGYTVSMLDVESDDTHPAREHIAGISMKHMLVQRSFSATRFERWILLKAALLFLRSILRLIRMPADIYHACEVTALPACYIAAKLRRKPLIFEAYELPLGDRPLSEMGRSRRLVHSMLTVLLAHMVPRCAAVITVSPPIVQEIRNRYAVAQVSLIRNILPYRVVAKSDRLRQLLGLAPQVRIALYQGYLQPDRSLDILVRAAAFLEPGIVIVMMGKSFGTTEVQLHLLIASEGVAERVKIIPPVPYEELLDWTASADVGLIVCSPDYAPNIQMLLPNKLFEYLMAGLPVLASQLDAVAQVLESCDVGQVVSSLAPAEVGAAINAMLADSSALARMRENALGAAQHKFCWEKEKNLLISLYQDVMGISSP